MRYQLSYEVLDTVFGTNVNNMVLVAKNYCEGGGNSDDGGKVFGCCKLVIVVVYLKGKVAMLQGSDVAMVRWQCDDDNNADDINVKSNSEFYGGLNL